ncbi:protein-disulfide reductase DsbD family protein [Asaia krungthepensis]|uniref:Cytochrome c biogenesis thiol:disulfide interchange protein DsbD n=1 Tax=Asaia krungthepensis NRIC 0535 TaxID=1307925 RepID=A0ABQ0PWR9_9PROT|nr:thioredoxin family protein [Asaia krungthepensis]GBQ83483.1 cytochrome c biogenesis thiol:disulfide interchange protein DsbD [Asaia krungthepensis NRIC 0535]
MLRKLSPLAFLLTAFGAFSLTPVSAPALAAESAPVPSAHDIATLVTDRDAVRPGETLHVGLRLQLKPGWHTYWLNAGDAGEAPTLKTTASGALSGQSDAIAFPTPVRISEGGLMSYAYTGDVLLPQSLKLAGSAGTVTLKAHAEWLVCASTCVPESGDFSLDLPASSDAQGKTAPNSSAQGPLFVHAAQSSPVPSPFAAAVTSDGLLSLSGQGLSMASVKRAWFMPSVTGVIDQVAPQKLDVSDGKVTLKLNWIDAAHRPATLEGIVVLQDEAGQQTPLWITTQSAAPAAAATSMPAAGQVPVMAPEAHKVQGALWKMLIFAFLGGLILNLMPCVFPVLAMKAFSLARLGGSHRHEQIQSALAYTTGVMGSFAALGVAMIVLRSVGSAAGWGFQFQSPIFVIGVAWLLVMMALNLLGVFEVTLGRIGQDVTPRHGVWGDMLTGLLAVIVATPCTAPFMGAAIAAALSGPAWAGMALFLAMGFGLASPYVAIATIPFLARHMPRPGAWMAVLKQALAFPLLGTSVWLFWVACVQRGAMILPVGLGGAVALGLAAWLFGTTQRQAMIRGATMPVIIGRVIALLALVLAGVSLTRIDDATADARPIGMTGELGVVAYSPERLASLRDQGKPVFIDMTAAWCITCMVNERVALQSAQVKQAFEEKNITYMKGDWTNRDETISAFLRDHGRDGVPLYVYYAPHKDGTILPQILTASGVLDTIK